MKTLISVSAGALLTLSSLIAWARADDCVTWVSPLVVDLNRDGFVFGAPGAGVMFDLRADGTKDHMQWVRVQGDEGFLVLDLNSNGKVDDGSELFGEGTTLLLTGEKAGNGYIALAQYDMPEFGGNDDGKISSADAIWPKLKIWLDLNADGKTQNGELKKLQASGITSLETIPKFRTVTDAAGNYMPMYSWVTTRQGQQMKMVDVFFQTLP